jgi:coproporphyrinogen III oxidase
MITFYIYKGSRDGVSEAKSVKKLTAKSMNSIYAQYKRYCQGKHATVMIQCKKEESIGCLYWSNLNDNFYLKES